MDSQNGSTKEFWNKLDVLGKLVSSVLLAIIAMFVKFGADDIASSMKRGELVRSLISDLTTRNEKVRQDIALIALDNAIGKDEPQLVTDIAERVFRDQEEHDSTRSSIYDGTTRSIAFDIIGRRSPERKVNIKDELEKRIQPILKSLRSNADTSNITYKILPPEAHLIAGAFKTIVYIQYKNPETKAIAMELQQKCEQSGWTAPGIERVDSRFSNSIRFFNAQDQSFAEKVADLTTNFLKEKGISAEIRVQDFSKSKFNAQEGQVEIWLSL
ncbi:MAG: hypothetical protein HY033_03030 [Ignavibacteriae bacterium]|nr:hypothetical protein [Ignavibacteria bacterium]MBI3363861.1 hypothetical protein [Ignavibacteriota bacterium]